MRDRLYLDKRPKRSLDNIAFYRNVIELFTLSRKLKATMNNSVPLKNRCPKVDLIIGDFSEQFIQLPISIAEAEVTEDQIKKIKAHLYINGSITYIFNCWSILNKHSSFKGVWKNSIEVKMNSLRYSYKDWAASLTCVN